MLFCKPIKRRATAKELFKIVGDFVKKKSIKLSDCVGEYANAGCIMVGNRGGLQALNKQLVTEAMWTHCMIHHESLATKELCPERSEVMNTVIKTVNYIVILITVGVSVVYNFQTGNNENESIYGI
jgi:hypothetical protein